MKDGDMKVEEHISVAPVPRRVVVPAPDMTIPNALLLYLPSIGKAVGRELGNQDERYYVLVNSVSLPALEQGGSSLRGKCVLAGGVYFAFDPVDVPSPCRGFAFAEFVCGEEGTPAIVGAVMSGEAPKLPAVVSLDEPRMMRFCRDCAHIMHGSAAANVCALFVSPFGKEVDLVHGVVKAVNQNWNCEHQRSPEGLCGALGTKFKPRDVTDIRVVSPPH